MRLHLWTRCSLRNWGRLCSSTTGVSWPFLRPCLQDCHTSFGFTTQRGKEPLGQPDTLKRLGMLALLFPFGRSVTYLSPPTPFIPWFVQPGGISSIELHPCVSNPSRPPIAIILARGKREERKKSKEAEMKTGFVSVSSYRNARSHCCSVVSGNRCAGVLSPALVWPHLLMVAATGNLLRPHATSSTNI